MGTRSPVSSRLPRPSSPPASARPPLRAARLLDQLRERIRYDHYSLKTEQSYVQWIRRFVHFHGLRHPREMGGPEVEAFLAHLANDRQVSPSTHHQALCALLYLYRHVIGVELPWMQAIGRPQQRVRIPVVLSRDEVTRLLAAVPPEDPPLLHVLYGAGLRIMEGLRLRIKDVDFDRRVIVVRDGKGGKDRVVMLPASLHDALRMQVVRARAVWAEDRAAARAGVWLPQALEKKFPRASASWAWHWVFPAPALAVDPRTGVERRHHLYEQRVSRSHVLSSSAAGLASPLDSLRCAEPACAYLH